MQETLQRFTDLLSYLLPLYKREGKSYVTVGIGCTGGRHRSVMIANALARALRRGGFDARAAHRDVRKVESRSSQQIPFLEVEMSSTLPSETKRVAGVIVTHGHLAGELLAAAEMIIGPISHIAAVSIGWHDDVDAAREEVQRAITRVSQGAGVLLLTDMFGGTPTNIASMFLEEGVDRSRDRSKPADGDQAGDVSTGEDSLTEIARKICDQGRQGIYLAGAIARASVEIRS